MSACNYVRNSTVITQTIFNNTLMANVSSLWNLAADTDTYGKMRVFDVQQNPAAADTSALSVCLARLTPTQDRTQLRKSLGVIDVRLAAGINVINLPVSLLDTAHSVRISGRITDTLVINIAAAEMSIHDLEWKHDGVLPARVVVNLPITKKLRLTGDHMTSFLAPQAVVSFPRGIVHGQIVGLYVSGAGKRRPVFRNAIDICPISTA